MQVKYVILMQAYISNTKQLRDYAKHAKNEGLELILYIRPGTNYSSALEAAGWTIKYLW